MRRDHALDLTGQRFGKWSVLGKSHVDKRREVYWLVRCECETERAVRASHLRSGASRSCGCGDGVPHSKHGMTLSRTWKSWNSMRQRCLNTNAPDYSRYGGRGIKICQRWDSFDNFLADMGERPDGKTIERNEVDGDYTPENCRWATASEQQRNKRNAIVATVDGVTKSVHDWACETGLPVNVIKWRLAQGWAHSKAISHPVRPKAPSKESKE